MYRRAVISAISTASVCAIAGCLRTDCTGGTDVDIDPADTNEIAAQVAVSDRSGASPTVTTLLSRSADGDESEVESIDRFPVDRFTYFERDGRFFEIDTEVVADGSVTGPEYELARDPRADDAISFADLPFHDRWRLTEATGFALDRGDVSSIVTSFVAGYLDADDQDASVLATVVDESALEVDGSSFALEHVGEGTAPAWRLRYTAELVAEDADEFADIVLEPHGVVLSDPSDDVRQLFDDARENDDSVTVCNHDVIGEDDVAAERRRNGFAELREALDSIAVEPDPDGDIRDRNKYVRYEGKWYTVHTSGWAV